VAFDVFEVHLLARLGAFLEERIEVADDANVADVFACACSEAVAFPLGEPFFEA
jgi:hypothetical protein